MDLSLLEVVSILVLGRIALVEGNVVLEIFRKASRETLATDGTKYRILLVTDLYRL